VSSPREFQGGFYYLHEHVIFKVPFSPTLLQSTDPIVGSVSFHLLKQSSAIEEERYRAVVDAAYLHIPAENSFFNSYALLGNQFD